MSTPYNDQWALHRAEHGHPAACAPAEQGEKRDAAAAAEVRAARRAERRRAAHAAGALCKRPKWIDRDT